MPLYIYSARDKEGNVKKGEIDLDSEAKLAEWLYSQGFLLTHFDEKGKKGKILFLQRILTQIGHISLMDKVLFTQYLEVMLKAGLSLVKALHILVSQTANRKFKRVIQDLHRSVETGVTFCDALARHPKVFPDLYVNVVKTGEVSGTLTQALNQLAVQLKKDRDLVKKVTGAMTYPAVVLVAMGGIGFLMMTFVLPKLVTIFEEFDARLPLPTRILIATSKFMGAYVWWILGGIVLFGFLAFKVVRSRTGRLIFHRIYLYLPVIGKVVKKINLARFIRNLASLLASGLPILEALNVVSDALGNVYYQKAVKASIVEVQKGTALSKALAHNKLLFPPIITQVLEVGEETGALDEILVKLAEFYEEDVDQTMKNISTIVEPVLMLVIGAAVGAMAIAVILPIYSLTSVL